MSQDIVKIWGPPVIFQIHQGFPLPNIHAIWGMTNQQKLWVGAEKMEVKYLETLMLTF